jgi:hypothetical protein
MLKTAPKGNQRQMLRRDITYRVALYPTTVKMQDVISFVERFIDAERLPDAVRRNLCIKSSWKFRKREAEIAIRGSLDYRYGTSSDFERVSGLVRRISKAVEKEFFARPRGSAAQ